MSPDHITEINQFPGIDETSSSFPGDAITPYDRPAVRIGKRFFDIIFALLVIGGLLSWLLPILSLLIRLGSKGPAFFVQERIGLHNKKFLCLKLRTMEHHPQSQPAVADTDDSRVTFVGKFLRVAGLDELPQFFNVLLGDMSVVGPRPHLQDDCLKFSALTENYSLRHLVKPGITGLAQVKGYKGKARGYYDILHRYEWDMFYVMHGSPLLDARIMFKTLSQMLTVLSDFARPETACEAENKKAAA